MRLHQINLEYDAAEDRLVMRLATTEATELRVWLTRRFVKVLWPMLIKLAEHASPRIRSQANAEARRALLGMEHEEAISRANFDKPYESASRDALLGDKPLLAVRATSTEGTGGQVQLALFPAQGQGVTLGLDPVLLHSLCKLIQAAVSKSGWDLELHAPGTVSAEPAVAETRTIN